MRLVAQREAFLSSRQAEQDRVTASSGFNVSTNRCRQSSVQANGCRRGGCDEFVISLLPEDLIVFRHGEPGALRKACLFLLDGKL